MADNLAVVSNHAAPMVKSDLTFRQGGGAMFIAVAIMLYYLALAEMLADEGVHLLPIFPLPRGISR